MREIANQPRVARRSFLARLGAGIGLAGAAVAGSASMVQGAPTPSAHWRPAHDPQDQWLDQVPGEHRFVFDATTADGMSRAVGFASNYYKASEQAYGLKNSDLAVLIVMRHRATPFGFTNTIWAKYGKQLTDQAEFSDPKTGEPFLNRVDRVLDRVFTSASLGNVFAGSGTDEASQEMSDLIKRGVRFAVCAMSALSVCGVIARATGGNADAVYKEFEANLIPNARIVSAGIVAVNRAQEHGYSYVYTG
jgi:intracellular sulfur oxidation DsrE/DsrF family protein